MEDPIQKGQGEKQGALVAVAGHVCLDIIPTFPFNDGAFMDRLVPGGLVRVGPAKLATGGAVSNTGLALFRLGLPVSLIGKVGSDVFGSQVLSLLDRHDIGLSAGMVVDEGSSTSYTIVISPPDTDRLFLHSTGANDTFCARDVRDAHLKGIRLFHFGYPPLMRRMYEHGGRELETLFKRVKNKGVVTSLDMAKPDPVSDAGRADWTRILKNILPHVDLFLPSFDEILYMIEPGAFDRLTSEHGEGNLTSKIDVGLLDHMADRLLKMGSQVVAIKLGDAGLYLRTAADAARLSPALGRATELEAWKNRQLLAPCFLAEVVGATGTGDCTIAGFLAAILDGGSPEQAIIEAVGVGACCTEAPDATSGVIHRDAVRSRIGAGWKKLSKPMDLPGWEWDQGNGLWKGPRDMA